MHLDRHLFAPRHSNFDLDSGSEAENPERSEQQRRLEERWKYDEDDSPATGPQGNDEQPRKLIDDFRSR